VVSNPELEQVKRERERLARELEELQRDYHIVRQQRDDTIKQASEAGTALLVCSAEREEARAEAARLAEGRAVMAAQGAAAQQGLTDALAAEAELRRRMAEALGIEPNGDLAGSRQAELLAARQEIVTLSGKLAALELSGSTGEAEKATNELHMLSEVLAPAGSVGDQLRMRMRGVPNTAGPGGEVRRYLSGALSWVGELKTTQSQAPTALEATELEVWKKKYSELKEEIDMVWETNAQLQDALKVWMETKGIR